MKFIHEWKLVDDNIVNVINNVNRRFLHTELMYGNIPVGSMPKELCSKEYFKYGMVYYAAIKDDIHLMNNNDCLNTAIGGMIRNITKDILRDGRDNLADIEILRIVEGYGKGLIIAYALYPKKFESEDVM